MMLRRGLRSTPFVIVTAFGGLTACGGNPDDAQLDFESVTQEFRADDDDCDDEGERSLSVDFLGRYSSGLVGFESSAETTAIHRDRMYVTNAEAAALDVVDISDPASPALVTRVDLTGYGPSIQSVDVSSRGLVAVAVAGAARTDPGKIVLLDERGKALRTVAVGALPDMVTFTHDGKQLLVANEGEPDCYGAGCTDPEGTVSIIDVHPLKAVLPVKTIGFSGVPLPPGVRVFGPGATPAQDLEPEYITISKDDKLAYVTLQEANAVAVIDIKRGKVVEVRALGYKDFSAAPTTETYEVTDLPPIGTTAGGQELLLGGFSGLYFEGRTADGKLRFLTHTDRGPNAEPTGILRPFLLPDFTPRLVRLELDEATGKVAIVEQILLKDAAGAALTGLPNLAVAGGNANTPHNDEVPVDLFGNVLPLDPLGADLEGIAVTEDGSFWMADEYRPALYHFSPGGVLLARLVPVGAHAAAGLPVPPAGVAGELGIEALPSAIAQRRQNRGFEAIAYQGGKLYAFVQSPIRNPDTLPNGTLNAMQNVRLVEVDPVTLATRQFLYALDNAAAVSADDTRADKIGDMATLGTGFLVVERDDDSVLDDAPETIAKKVYSFAIGSATDITSKDVLYAGKSLDQMTASELSAVGVTPIAKVLHTDLVQAGYGSTQKVEGIAVIDPTTFAVINDNDFGVASIVTDPVTGTFTPAPGYVPEPELLGIVTKGGFDASDRDGVINIRNWPVYGMYQPDAIESYETRGAEFVVTANEGDTRDYDGFAEEARARSIRSLYPGITEVTDDRQVGRLTVTVAPPDGDLSQPYVFGTRSFSIWDAATGALVWDSGAELERRTAEALPAFFNSNHESNDFDTRSDNKGPEPEGVAIGKVRGRSYAFVGLERMSGVMIYDVTDPTAPEFVKYVNDRDYTGSEVGPDSGAEIIRFVPAKDSPTRDPLLVSSNEISGTVSIWQLGR